MEDLSFEVTDLNEEEVTIDDRYVKLKLKDSITAHDLNKFIL